MSGKSFKVLKDEELLVPVNKNREGHTAQSLSFNLDILCWKQEAFITRITNQNKCTFLNLRVREEKY